MRYLQNTHKCQNQNTFISSRPFQALSKSSINDSTYALPTFHFYGEKLTINFTVVPVPSKLNFCWINNIHYWYDNFHLKSSLSLKNEYLTSHSDNPKQRSHRSIQQTLRVRTTFQWEVDSVAFNWIRTASHNLSPHHHLKNEQLLPNCCN